MVRICPSGNAGFVRQPHIPGALPLVETPAFISLEHSIVVRAPVDEVYDGWSHIEQFPRFMEGVREIRWEDANRFLLISESDGQLFESLCEMTVRIPGKRIAWRTLSGPDSSGVVRFETGEEGTRVTLMLRYDPSSAWQNQQQVEERLRLNLARFRDLQEGRGC